ncbi:MAG TPA: RagB/SusD family nutrient uptake outer membrane protein, partial [Flavisolibacter sp.]|nr:RagB/SusD family nutrient uptake outer membrane protein [Flavisolibacter sp.]
MYTYLRMANTFLVNANNSVIFPVEDIPSLRGEAFFLRAMYHFELFKRYGRIVLANRVFSATENLDLPRNSIDEVVRSISADCDSATALISAVWTGAGTVAPYGDGYDPANRGRATKAAAMALKARTLLYYASPLHNTANDITRWQAAADASKAVMNLGKHDLIPRAQLFALWDYNTSLVYNREVIFATSANARNDIEVQNAPIGFGGLGRTNPTQDLVDVFEMTNGRPITDPASGYNPANPYANRDPRLSLFIIHNGASFKLSNTTARPVETFEGGQDNIQSNPNSTKTGYYMRKFLSESAAISPAVQRRRPWVFFRYAETLLNFAEAQNEATGPTTEVYNAVNLVRVRGGLPALPAGLTQDQMRLRIRNERRVELSFEQHRFFDVRRWKLGEALFNGPVRGMRIVRTGTTLTYTPFVVENRVFTSKNYFYPIAQNELNRAPALQQNPGY